MCWAFHLVWEQPSLSKFLGVPLSLLKESACSSRDLVLIPGSGRSPGDRNGNPLQSSCLENSMYRGARWATVHGVVESDTTDRLFFKAYAFYGTWPLPVLSVSAGRGRVLPLWPERGAQRSVALCQVSGEACWPWGTSLHHQNAACLIASPWKYSVAPGGDCAVSLGDARRRRPAGGCVFRASQNWLLVVGVLPSDW